MGCASDAVGPDATVQGGNTLSEVKERNLLIVGIDGSLPGFSDPAIQARSSAGGDAQTGIGVDLGLALTAAIFGKRAITKQHRLNIFAKGLSISLLV